LTPPVLGGDHAFLDMSALTSLLARDSVVAIRTIEEAIQRQVISGGDLPTVLLEMGAVPENVLASYLAAQHGLVAAGREEVMEVPERLLVSVPKEIAIEHRLIPIGESGDRLIIASSAPIERDQRRELAFVFGRPIENRIAVDLRISAGLEKHYGETASRREQRILRKVAERAPGELREIVPLDTNRVIRPQEQEDSAGSEPRGGAPTRYLNEAAKTQRASEGKPSNAGAWTKARKESIAPVRPDDHADALNAPEPTRRALARPGSPLVDRHRGPLTARDAVSMLGEADSRDDILAVSMAFVRQFFDCSLLFVIHDDEAEGLDAHGNGPSWKEIQRISVPLDQEGSFQVIREQLSPRVVKLGGRPVDDELLTQIGRTAAQPALVAPVAIRQRVILMIYADRSGERFSLSDIPEVNAFLPRISDAIQRLILKRKAGAAKAEAPEAPPEAVPTRATSTGFAKPKPPATGEWAVSKKEEPSPPIETAQRRRKPSYAAEMAMPSTPPPPRPEVFDVLGVPREAPPPPAAADARRARKSFDTSYRSREASVDVVDTSHVATEPGFPAAVQPRAPETDWVPRDARRERGDSEPPVDVVSIPDPRPPSMPPRARGGDPNMPSIIVQTYGDVGVLVAELAETGLEDADEVVARVVSSGDTALPVLVEAFPGRLWALRSAGPLPRGRDVSGIARAISLYGPSAAPFVASLLEREDADERYFALSVARDVFTHELGVPVEHLLYDDDREIRRHAAELLRTLDAVSPVRRSIVDRLVQRARSANESEEKRLHAVAALGSFADGELVPTLIELLDDESPSVQGVVMANLVLITAQDFGPSSRKWIPWFERNRDRHRVEWLIDGLMHEAETVRRAAGAELQRITREYYGYHPVLPKREREVLQKRYRTWWETTGRTLFA
jgi:hypothetical protein